MPIKDPVLRKKKQKECSARWYQANKNKHKANVAANNRAFQARNRKLIEEYKKTHPCVDCGFSNPLALDFDHVRGKKKANVAILAHTSYSEEALWREIAKCEVRCANCHRIITAERRKRLNARIV